MTQIQVFHHDDHCYVEEVETQEDGVTRAEEIVLHGYHYQLGSRVVVVSPNVIGCIHCLPSTIED